ncbi:MAG: protoporphyrinogen/coproporphyrinogen oxidase [Myxococcales bacterium]
MSAEILILGGGLAGLSAAYHLGGGFRILEKSDRVGGFTRTEVLDGFSFDVTGHWLHLRDPETKALVARLMPDAFVTIQRVARVFSHGVFTRYPYQVNTHGLPPGIVSECVVGFVEANYGEQGRPLRERAPQTFADFILRYLGEGFAKHFMFPYNQKIYTVHPRELTADWCGRFVPKPTLKEVVDGALGVGTDQAGYNATFLYPKEGGIEALPRSFLPHLKGPVECGVQPVAIDWKGRTLALSDGRTLPWTKLLSTINLPHVVQLLEKGGAPVPAEVSSAARRLRGTTVTYVNVAAKGTGKGIQWVYFPEPEFAFYRAGSFSAAYDKLAPPGCQSFYVEFAAQGPLDHDLVRRQAIEGLVKCGLLESADDVLFAVVREIQNAYVLYDRDYGPARQTVMSFLDGVGIETAGRYGKWEYSSMEDAIIAGREAAKRLRA